VQSTHDEIALDAAGAAFKESCLIGDAVSALDRLRAKAGAAAPSPAGAAASSSPESPAATTAEARLGALLKRFASNDDAAFDDAKPLDAAPLDAPSPDRTAPDAPSPDAAVDATLDATLDAPDGTAPDVTAPDAVADAPDAGLRCPVTFRYRPPTGRAVSRVEVTGEWNAFANPGVAMRADGRGGYAVDVALAPGLHAYKLLVDGAWELDPDGARRKYLDGVENSAVLVRDCRNPTLTLVTGNVTRPAMGDGRYRAEVTLARGLDGTDIDAPTVRATLRRDATTRALAGVTYDVATGRVGFEATGLGDGKYTVTVEGRVAEVGVGA
jgi:hypothetical protein